MIVIVQLVEVIWTKASRSAPTSVVRNALPRAVTLVPTRPAAYIFQHVAFHERTGFAQELLEGIEEHASPARQGEIMMAIHHENRLSVGWGWTSQTGKPFRHFDRNAMHLGSGQYGRIMGNGKRSTPSTPSYRQTTYNIAVVTGDVDIELFTSRDPDIARSFEADLL